jgi:hypothetical protein
METKRYVYYEEDGLLVGWLEEYPDYLTQGETMDQLQDHLLDLYKELTSGEIPCVRRVGELSIA